MLPRDMAYDTGAGKLYVADHTLGRVLVLQGDTMVCDNHNVRGMDYTNAQNLLLDDERGYLIMVTEPGLLLRNTGDSVKKLDLRAWPQEIVYNQRNAALYAVGSTGLRRLLRVDVENMQITAKRFIHSYVWGIAGDFKANRIFAARCNLGDVLVYDADTLEKIARIPVATGLRAMIYDPIRDYLYVGSYIDGTVHVVDCADYSKLGEIKLWPQIRDMDLGPVSNDLYVDCVTGLFRIEPERALRIK